MRVYHQTSSARAKDYYSASDYYESGPENLKGQWIGKGADLLGLKGDVDQQKFDRLCDNLHPDEDQRLTLANVKNRRVLSDITLSVPKSVSILFAASNKRDQQRILNALEKEADATFQDLERDALTRVNHEYGKLTTSPTGNLLAARWIHLTTRPVEDAKFGLHPDPQLHVHFATINATHTGDNRWTAVDLSNVVRDSGYFEAVFQSRLASSIQKLGYAVERSEFNFEVSGVRRETVEKFSRRTTEIDRLIDEGVADKIAAKEGVKLADAKDMVGARSREKKNSLYSTEELSEIWKQRFSAEEKNQIEAVANRKIKAKHRAITKQAAVDFATEHRFERESVTRERQLIRDALLYGIGDTTVGDIHREVAKRSWIRDGKGADALISTKEVLAEEQAVLAFARNGRGSIQPLAPNHRITRDWLSEEQQQAVKALLKSTDRVQILRGVAGSGKTTLMTEAITDGIEKAGTQVTVLAPTAEAAYDVLANEGFDSHTLASFLLDRELQQNVKNGVIWVDEAGLAGMQDIRKLTSIAEQMNARIILSGDKQQHKAVSRGEPLRLLESQAGIKPHEITKVRRQQGEFQDQYREAVSKLSDGNAVEGFDMLNALGFVHELADDERYERLASDYVDNIDAGKKTLVIAPTHAEREIVTDAIRDELKNRGHITGEDHTVDILKSKRLTEAERSDPFNYSENDVVEFVKRSKGGFKAGDRMHVVSTKNGRVFAATSDGLQEVPIDSPNTFDVYRWQSTKLAAGDTIRVTKRNRNKNLYNGTLAKLKGFDEAGNLKLGNGQTLSADWGHIDNGIAITSHASQGKTFKRVLVAQSSLSFPASTPEQIYVTASRGVERVDFYTDDTDSLRSTVSQLRPSKLATELKPNQQSDPLQQRVTQLRQQASQFVVNQLRQMQQWLHTQMQQAR